MISAIVSGGHYYTPEPDVSAPSSRSVADPVSSGDPVLPPALKADPWTALFEAPANTVVPAIARSNLTITPTFGASITSGPDASTVEATIDTSIANLERYVTTMNPVSVRILFNNMPTGLGSNSTPQDNVSYSKQDDLSYSTYLSDLQANPNKSGIQTIAYATLPAGPNAGINGATQVRLTPANLAAIGETAAAAKLVRGNGGYDGKISLNLSKLNVTRPDAKSNKFDLQSVATHEVDEVLGAGGNASSLYQPKSTPPASLPTDIRGLDLFRYSAPGVRSFTYNPKTSAYFSIDGGKTKLVYFNQQNGANDVDFGDWGNPYGTGYGNTRPQVQDDFGTPGGMANLGANELTALNVIGYNLTAAGFAVKPAAGLASAVDGIKINEAGFTPAEVHTLTDTLEKLNQDPLFGHKLLEVFGQQHGSFDLNVAKGGSGDTIGPSRISLVPYELNHGTAYAAENLGPGLTNVVDMV